MAEFLESPVFPVCISYGFISQPDYTVSITRTRGGQEDRIALWSRPLYQYQVTVGPRKEDEIQEILDFWHAVGGSFCGFRFLDYADYKSCHVQSTPTPIDQPLVLSAASPGGYQLTKRYTAGARTQDREITKPIASSIRVANQLGVEQSSDRWALDPTTGLIVPLGGFVGTPSTWGGEFHVPVRFASEFPIELANYKIQSVSFTLQEIR